MGHSQASQPLSALQAAQLQVAGALGVAWLRLFLWLGLFGSLLLASIGLLAWLYVPIGCTALGWLCLFGFILGSFRLFAKLLVSLFA